MIVEKKTGWKSIKSCDFRRDSSAQATSKELRDHESADHHLDMIAAYTARQEQRLRRLEDNHQSGGGRATYQNVGDVVDAPPAFMNELQKVGDDDMHLYAYGHVCNAVSISVCEV